MQDQQKVITKLNATATMSDKIWAAEERLAKLKAEKRKTDVSQKALGRKAGRAADTRKKYLLGAVVMANMAEGNLDKAAIYKLLESGLVKNADRALFDLAPLTPEYDMDTGKDVHI